MQFVIDSQVHFLLEEQLYNVCGLISQHLILYIGRQHRRSFTTMPAWVHNAARYGPRVAVAGGAAVSCLAYRRMVYNEKQRTIRELGWRYSSEVQGCLAYLGAQRNYLEVHGVRLEDFMREFPRGREFPVRCFCDLAVSASC